jgi:hypothetical protein
METWTAEPLYQFFEAQRVDPSTMQPMPDQLSPEELARVNVLQTRYKPSGWPTLALRASIRQARAPVPAA